MPYLKKLLFLFLPVVWAFGGWSCLSQTREGNIPDVSEDAFESEVLQASSPVFVDFWAPWCGPCRMVAPAVEDLSVEYRGKVKFLKVNVDNAPNLSRTYQVRAIPALYLFHNGDVVQRWVGVHSKEALKAGIDEFLKSLR